MTRAGAEQAVIASAIVVSGTWGYRKLVEPIATTSESSNAIKQLIGLEPTPAPAAQFVVGFAFTYMALSLTAIAAPDVAGAMAILIATGAVLANGATLFTDISSQTGGKQAKKKPAAKKGK